MGNHAGLPLSVGGMRPGKTATLQTPDAGTIEMMTESVARRMEDASSAKFMDACSFEDLESRSYTFKEVILMSETAYRRGFVQGVAACLRNHDLPLHRLRNWLTKLHLKWRNKNHRGNVEHPNEQA